MPTEFSFEYRDFGGFKTAETVVFPDSPKQHDIDLIYSNLLDEEYFIPSQVGLEDLQERLSEGQPLGKNDHVEHIILSVGITELTPTTNRLFEDFAKAFASTTWDLLKAMEIHGLSCDSAINYFAQFLK